MRCSRFAVVAMLLCGAACRLEERPPAEGAGRGAVVPDRFGIGGTLAAAQLAAWDTDVDGAGRGLPAGRGDARRGAALYRTKCAPCHGRSGEGIASNPPLIGREPREGFPFASDPALVKTIGNYWPYAPTVFDYVRRTMPLDAPGSLTNDEVYSLTAFLLAANDVIADGASLDSASLAAVRMPARDRFVRDDRRGGSEVR
jgi:cytochrome c